MRSRNAEVTVFKDRAQQAIFADINATLKRIGIGFDTYFNEHTLYEDGRIDEVVAALRAKGLVYEKEGAIWFKTTEFGQEQDRVIIKSTGEPTYRLPDIAYHCEKFRRGFDWMVNVFGSDHIATVPDVLAGVGALGYDRSKVTVVLHQFVTLIREGKQVKMSTRKANFVTVDELVDEVGPDALRFFFLMRKADSQLEFDLDLAKKQSQENPVYYVQYAHARLSSIGRQAEEKGVARGELAEALLSPARGAGGAGPAEDAGRLAGTGGRRRPGSRAAPGDLFHAGDGRPVPQLLQQAADHLRGPGAFPGPALAGGRAADHPAQRPAT